MSDEIEVKLYALPNGRAPFERWLKGLRDRRARARVNVKIGRLRLGNFGDAKSVGEGVFELRIDYGPGYRVYFGRVQQTVVLLLSGGDKDSQAEDIQTAKSYWREFKSGAREGRDEKSE